MNKHVRIVLSVAALAALTAGDGDCTDAELAQYDCAKTILGREPKDTPEDRLAAASGCGVIGGSVAGPAIIGRASTYLGKSCAGRGCVAPRTVMGTGTASAGGTTAESAAMHCLNCGSSVQVTTTSKGTGGSFSVGAVESPNPTSASPRAQAAAEAARNLGERLRTLR